MDPSMVHVSAAPASSPEAIRDPRMREVMSPGDSMDYVDRKFRAHYDETCSDRDTGHNDTERDRVLHLIFTNWRYWQRLFCCPGKPRMALDEAIRQQREIQGESDRKYEVELQKGKKEAYSLVGSGDPSPIHGSPVCGCR